MQATHERVLSPGTRRRAKLSKFLGRRSCLYRAYSRIAMPVRVGRVLEEDEQLDSPSAPPESPVEASAGEIAEHILYQARTGAENALSNIKDKAESAAKDFSERTGVLASLSCISLRKEIPGVLSSPHRLGLPSVDKAGWQLPTLPWMGTRKPAAKPAVDNSVDMQALHTLHTLHAPLHALYALRALRARTLRSGTLHMRCGSSPFH